MATKSLAQQNTFVGISSVYLLKGGFTTADGAVTITGSDALVEVPCSQESGFSFDGGTPSVNNFRIHGMTAAYASTFTPGDGSLTIEIPTNETGILDLVYGITGAALEVNTPIGNFEGKAYPFAQKAIEFGIIAINDTEDKALFFKKIKATATPSFDGSEKPYAITLTATISGGADADAVAILTKKAGA